MIFEQPAVLKSFSAFNSIASKLHYPNCFLIMAIYVFLKTQNLKVLQVSFLFFIYDFFAHDFLNEVKNVLEKDKFYSYIFQ